MSTTLTSTAPVHAGTLGAEVRATTWLALPLAATQLGQIAINLTDVLFLGQLGTEALAAATLAIALYHVVLVSCFGVVTATTPLAAQAIGARRFRRARQVIRQGFWVTVAITAPCVAALWFTSEILELLGQSPQLAAKAEQFMHTLSFAIPSAVGFVVLRSFITAFERTVPIVVTMFAGVAVNAFLNWLLVFGHWGFPRLELVGSGLSSMLVNAAMLVALAIYASKVAPYRRYAILARFWHPDWPIFREIMRVGLPIGLMLLTEVGMFAGAAFLMGWIGTREVAAHQIAIQLASTSFMVPLGVSMAATVRVGLSVGRGDFAGARRAGFVAAGMGAAFMGACGVLFWLVPEQLAGFFLSPDDLAAPAVLALAASFLRIAAIFQLVDGLQVIGAGALRGLRDTRVPMLIAILGYWAVGLPVCLVLGFAMGFGGQGIWAGLAVALLIVATLMMHRFDRLTRFERRPAVA
jgi:MATE family multidrug resistance protein